MIYYIANTLLLEQKDIKKCSIEYCLEYFKDIEEIGVDTETTGLDPHIDKILMIQFSDGENEFVIDCTTTDITRFKEILETKLLIIQFAKFDLQMLFSVGIYPTKIYDPFLAETVLTLGYKNVGRSLEDLTRRYLKIELDKSYRLNFTGKNYTINYKAIFYGANDVKYLHNIKKVQLDIGNKKGVIKAIDLENSFVIPLSYIEFCGVYLDKERWIQKYESAHKELSDIISKLDNWVIENGHTEYLKLQQDLFSQSTLTPKRKITINWNSGKQLIPLFKKIGVNVSTDTNKSGESISEKILNSQKDVSELIPLYLKYQTIQKDFSTYGPSFLDHIHPVTGRIHAEYDQIKNTSRLGCANPNMQNLPRDERTRSCFTAEKGNILVGGDYKAQEDILFVNKSKEKKMIEFYQLENADGHSYVAKLCFPYELEDIPLEKIKDEAPKLRQIAKSAKFAIHYSGTGYTIAKNLNLSEIEGERIYEAYLTAFPDIARYLKDSMENAERRGYILISEVTGRKFWCDNYDKLVEENDYKALHAFAKLACNYPIQGAGAETIKISLILFYKWIVDNNYLRIIKIVSTIHDEINIECPINLANLVAENLKICMEQAGSYYCKIVPLKAEPVISNHWKH